MQGTTKRGQNDKSSVFSTFMDSTKVFRISLSVFPNNTVCVSCSGTDSTSLVASNDVKRRGGRLESRFVL